MVEFKYDCRVLQGGVFNWANLDLKVRLIGTGLVSDNLEFIPFSVWLEVI